VRDEGGSRSGADAMTPEAVIGFWFDELTPEDWFTKSDETDARIADRLGAAAEAAAAGALDHWAETPEGALALVILLDQCPRNLHRDSARAFAQDAKALTVADAAVDRGFDERLPKEQRFFLYMPFEHSEDLADQDRCVALFEAYGNERYLDYAKRHRAVIARFGRFPHRNPDLGRESTQEELDYLEGRDEPF